ncbi:MAG: enoyl-CoA hydratase, partial [Nisaea sp.]|nr:enoyl-CoA hydratase [Nisaea sp.]
MDFVTIEKQGRIAIVRFDRGTPANPMSQALLRELTAAAHSFDHDSETSAVVLA